MSPKNITNISFTECTNSKYINPKRMVYSENNQEKQWDIIEVHNSVAILLYHEEKESFLLVKQFRPAVYLKEQQDNKNSECGYTYELCAGIMDKDKNEIETAQEEILEECGYDVPLEKINEITEFYTAVGFAGSKQTVFYAKINDKMKINDGGGVDGENIEIVYINKNEALEFAFNKKYPKTSGAIFAILWFLEHIK